MRRCLEPFGGRKREAMAVRLKQPVKVLKLLLNRAQLRSRHLTVNQVVRKREVMDQRDLRQL